MELFKMGRIFDPVSATEHTSSLDFVDFLNFFHYGTFASSHATWTKSS